MRCVLQKSTGSLRKPPGPRTWNSLLERPPESSPPMHGLVSARAISVQSVEPSFGGRRNQSRPGGAWRIPAGLGLLCHYRMVPAV